MRVPSFDATTATCRIFTFKEGALSAVAHDLELAVDRFAIVVADDQAIDATFQAGSLRVLHAVKDGRASDALSANDKQKIARSIADDVLHSARFPEIRFRSSSVTAAGTGFAIAGELTLHGKARPLQVTTRLEGSVQVAEGRLHQPDFGIKPYSAMLGALKVKADVTLRLMVPWPAA